MRFRFDRLRVVFAHVGTVLFVFGLVLLVPFTMSLFIAGGKGQDVRAGTFAIPIVISLVLGAACRWQMHSWPGERRVGTPEAMLICVFGWLAVSAVGAIPFSHHLGISYLDAYFEAMSGFTTTGITMLSGLDGMPRSLLFWRSMTQWVGGLGILTFFMALVFEGGLSHRLYGAESAKMEAQRGAPGIWRMLQILWLIYVLWTAAITAALYACGMSLYDAVSHALTCVSTAGYSTHDASIAYYERAGYAHHAAIEYVLILGMWAGATNFLVHYRLLRGGIKALWDSDEMRLWWCVLGGALLLVLGSRLWSAAAAASAGTEPLSGVFRHSLFQAISIGTTTGYSTRDIATDYFPPLAKHVFLALMVIGGCGGSTAAALKIPRFVILGKLMVRQVKKAVKPESEVDLLLVDGRKVSAEEIERTAGLLVAWLVLLLAGSVVTAALSPHGALESASGMFSALGNIGPCYIPVPDMMRLNPAIKVFYIFAMLAGRLEIVPVLILFNPRTWR